MRITIIRCIWSAIAALGLQFLFLGARVERDRSFLHFGLSLLLLCMVMGVGTWICSDPALDPGTDPTWLYITHLLIFACFPFLVLFMLRVTDWRGEAGFRGFAGLSAAMAAGFAADWWAGSGALFQRSPGRVDPTFLYDGAMGAYSLAFLVLVFGSLARKLRICPPAERKDYLLLLSGWLAVAGGGLADLSAVMSGNMDMFPSFFLLGALAYALVASLLLIERLTNLHAARAQALDELAGAHREARESAGLRELGASTSFVGHELINYLAALKGNSHLLRARGRQEAAGEELRRIEALTDRMEAFTRGLLDYARGADLRASEDMDLRALAEDCARRLFPGREGSFAWEVTGPLPSLRGDPARLEQAFSNLYRNAFEAGAERISLRFRARGRAALVTVEDDGAGCAPGEAARIFTLFFTTKRAQGGTGLGTSIARAAVRAHGGEIAAYAKNALPGGRGLVFELAFPLAAEVPGPAAPALFLAVADPALRQEALRVARNLRLEPSDWPGPAAGRAPRGRRALVIGDAAGLRSAAAQEAWVLRLEGQGAARPRAPLAAGEGEACLFREGTLLDGPWWG